MLFAVDGVPFGVLGGVVDGAVEAVPFGVGDGVRFGALSGASLVHPDFAVLCRFFGPNKFVGPKKNSSF